MKNIILILNLLLSTLFSFSQKTEANSKGGNLSDGLPYEIHKIYPSISVTRAKLKDAQTLIDLNTYYKPSWVKKYSSVKILTTHKGEQKIAKGINDTLNQKQKDFMIMADVGTEISVNVQYIPENTLTNNDMKEINFTFTVAPENEAKYIGEQQQLKYYIKHNAIDKIPDGSFKNWDLAAVKFTIDEEGKIINTHVVETSKDKKIDQLLLETISKMPKWKPAEYLNGLKVKQEFVLTVGNMENCVINLLNINRPD